MGTYIDLTCSESNPYRISNTTGSFTFSVTRKNVYSSQPNVIVRWGILNGTHHTLWSTSMTRGDTKIFTISHTDLLNEMSTTGTATIRISANCNTDSLHIDRTVNIDSTVICPDVTQWTSSIVNTPLNGILVRGYSSVRYSYTATKGWGASQVLLNFTAPYGTFNPTGISSRADTLTGRTQFHVDGGSDDLTFSAKIECRDSRMQTVDIMSAIATWKGYTKPEITATAVRCDSNGNPDESGAYAKITFSATYSLTGLGNVGHVSMTTGGTTYTDPNAPMIIPQAQATTTTYTITATDTVLNSVSQNVSVRVIVYNAKFPLDLYDDGRGHFGARVGAIAKSGWFVSGLQNEFTKDTILRNHFSNYISSSLSTTNGYVVVATIKVTGTYADAPIFMRLSKRGYASWYVIIRFTNENNTDPTLSYFRTDIYTSSYLYKSRTSTWQLIIPYSGYDHPAITDIQMSNYQSNCVSIDYTMSYLSTLPSGGTYASPMPLYGVSTVGSNAQPIYLNSGSPTAVLQPTSGAWFRGIPKVDSNGIMEIGRFIDFHTTDTGTTDYEVRLQADGTGILTIRNVGNIGIARWMQGISATSSVSATSGTFYRVPIDQTASNNPVINSSNVRLFETAYNGIKVKKTGKYRISGSIYIGTGTNGRAGAYIYESVGRDYSSSSTELIGNALYGNGTDVVVTISPRIISLTADHIIHLVGRAMSANGTIYYSNKSTYLLIEWVND